MSEAPSPAEPIEVEEDVNTEVADFDYIVMTDADKRVSVEIPFEEDKKPEPLDDLSALAWDGPEDSDEEIEEMAKLKTEWEIRNGVKFSKRGIIEYIENFLVQESKANKDPKVAKAWDQKLKVPALTYFLKKGGSDISSSQPFFRSEMEFKPAFKMQKVVNCVSSIRSNLTRSTIDLQCRELPSVGQKR